MLPDLTPEQRAKLARGWVWQEGHLPVGSKNRVSGYLAPRELTPDINDPVTADGLLRTARAMWRDESLYVASASPDGWMLCRVVRGLVESWGSKQWDLRIFSEHEVYPTEPAALLAAILAAPENQNV